MWVMASKAFALWLLTGSSKRRGFSLYSFHDLFQHGIGVYGAKGPFWVQKCASHEALLG